MPGFESRQGYFPSSAYRRGSWVFREPLVFAPARNSLQHGLYTRDKDALKLRARAVRRLVAKAYELCPWLTPTDRPTVQGWTEVVKLKSVAFVALERSNPY